MSLPPANWYADPWDPAKVRYWDGVAWTAHAQSAVQPTPQPVAPQAPIAPVAAVAPIAPVAPVAPQPEQGFDAIGGRIVAPDFRQMATSGVAPQQVAPSAPSLISTPSSISTPSLVSRPSFPPPAPEDMAFAPKHSRLGLWIALGAVGLVVVGVGVAVAVALGGKVAPLSNDYTGAPVTASDVASTGKTEITSTTETVALEIPQQWVNAADYMDVSGVSAGLPTGMGLVGAWFTAVPSGTNTPQLVMVLEAASNAAGIGSLSDFQAEAIAGLGKTDGFSGVGETSDVISANALEGKRTTATLDVGKGVTATMVIETFGHNRRLALVMWTSYSGPVDEAALQALTDALRVDS